MLHPVAIRGARVKPIAVTASIVSAICGAGSRSVLAYRCSLAAGRDGGRQ